MSSIDKINVGGVDFDINASPTPVMAPVETGTTATQPYAVGDYVIVGSTLHEVTSAIAIGDTFTEGINISTSTSLGDEIKQLNNDLTASDNLKFKFMTDGDGNYGYRGADDSFVPFKRGGAVLVGTYNANTTINVSTYGATSASQFLVVPINGSTTSREWSPPNPITYTAGYTHAVLSLSNNILSVTSPYVTWGRNYYTYNLSYKVYYVGDIS